MQIYDILGCGYKGGLDDSRDEAIQAVIKKCKGEVVETGYLFMEGIRTFDVYFAPGTVEKAAKELKKLRYVKIIFTSSRVNVDYDD